MQPKIYIHLFFIVTLIISFQPSALSQQKSAKRKAQSAKQFSLEELEHRTFNWFWDLVDKNYQVPDRHPTRQFSSIAATGFGLTTYCIGVERHYVTRNQAAERVLKTLQFLLNAPQGAAQSGVTGFHGFYYHFLDHENGTRYKDVELSTIDTGLLMAGVLSVMSYFDSTDATEIAIREVAEKLYRRVEWDWFQNDNKNLSMGYHPEKGFIKAEWIGYNEAMVLLIIAIGSPTHPIDASAWQRWCAPYKWETFYGQEHVNFDPLFGHQYSQMYIDFKGIQDSFMRAKGIDYFENSRRATLANRAYCIANPQKYKNYGVNEWGLTACDGPGDALKNEEVKELKNGKDASYSIARKFMGYSARGAASTNIVDDGTIAPTAVGGSLPFAPEVCLPALQNIWDKYYGTLITEYGFKDAYNATFSLQQSAVSQQPSSISAQSSKLKAQSSDFWIDKDYLGIDQGPIIIQIENYRSQFVWKLMRKNPYIVSGLKKAGFKNGWIDNKG